MKKSVIARSEIPSHSCRVDIRQMPPQLNPVKSHEVWQASQEKHKFLKETYQDENSIYSQEGALTKSRSSNYLGKSTGSEGR